MKKFLFAPVFVFAFVSTIFSQIIIPPTIHWQKSLGGTGSDIAYDTHPTSDGGYIIAGVTASNDGDVVGLHSAGTDCWVVKLSSNGVLQWQKTLGGSNDDVAQSIQETNDGGYIVAGHSNSNDGDVSGNHGGVDCWIVKLDFTGGIQWQNSFGGTNNEYPYSIQQTADSGYIFAGFTGSNNGDVSGTLGPSDAWIVKLNNAGNIQWQKTLGGSSEEGAGSIQQTNDGGYIIAAYASSSDGDVSLNKGQADYWIIKLNSSGGIQWQKTYGGTSWDGYGFPSAGGQICARQTNDAGYIVSGYTQSNNGDILNSHGSSEIWILKIDTIGNIQWQKCLGGSMTERTYNNALEQTTDNGYIVAGTSQSIDGDVSGLHGSSFDYWIVKLNAAGNIEWQKCYGSAGIELANSIKQTSDGDYIVAGQSNGINGDVSFNHGGWDYWIIKLGDSANSSISNSYPYITLSSGNIIFGQTISISGFSFKSSSLANIVISGPLGFNNTLSINITNAGTFTYNYITNIAMPIGQYTVSVVDSASGIYAPIKSFILNNNLNNSTKLVVLSPETNDTLYVNDTSQISWTDKLILGQNYTVNGAQRNYKYTIEYSANNGTNWQILTTKQGSGYINAILTFHIPVAFSNIGSNYLVRVVDFYNNSNADSSGMFRVINQPSLATNIKAELYWDFSYTNQNNTLYGVAADGAARIYLAVSKINPGIGSSISTVSVQVSDAYNSSTTTLGKVMAATQVSTYDNEANAANSLTATQSTEAFSRFWFWYVAPDDFAGNNPGDANSAYRYVTAHFTINYSNSTAETFNKQIKVVRPPLCLVHGLASDPSTWDNFRHDALGYELDFLNDNRFYTKRAIQLDAKASFNVNAQYLTIGFNNQNSLIFQNSLQGVIKDLRNQGYATNRCDYIGHSMGGCVLRYALDHYNNHFYRSGSASNLDYKNYGRGYVNKTITINTPHNSSPWADILNRYTPDLTVAMRVALGLDYGSFPNSLPFSFIEMDNLNSLIPTFTVVPAVRDLQIDQNQGGVNFGITNLKSHLIGSDFFPGVQNTSNNMIPQGVINFVDQAAEQVDFLNKFLDLTIAEEQDQQLVSDLIDITTDYSNPVQTALQYVDRMADLYNTAMFIPESDLVVGVSSQLADYPRTSPNVTVFDNYIGHAFIRPVLNDIDAGNKVNELLNQHISSNEFAVINATSNMVAPVFNNSRSTSVLVSYRDTTKLKILNPVSNAQLKTDSIFNIKVSLSDTTNLISWKVSFQNKTYKLSKIEGITDLNIQTNSNLLDSNYIFAEAFFKHPDTSFFFFDTVLVNVTTTSPLIGFSSKQKIIYLNINQTKTPDYVSYYNGFATAVSNFSQFISANVANTGIVSFNPFRKSFTGIATGETSAIVSYKGINDTTYFVVGENPLDSLSTDVEEITPSMEDKQLKLLCYPNPSNQKMIIDFNVATTGEVSIKVYDFLGHEQFTVFEGRIESGFYRTILDGSELSNGIYFCELKNENQRAISRIVLLR